MQSKTRSAPRTVEGQVEIRPVTTADRALWEPLWSGYLDFYGRTTTQATLEHTWTGIVERNDIHGLLAIDDELGAAGLIHSLFHPSTSAIGGHCYIQDLFVVPAARKRGIGRRLISAVVDMAKARQAAVVYWQTEEFNGTARRLYERVARRSPFIRYQIDL
jgi:GNAT superfamily N-acetyltransferase